MEKVFVTNDRYSGPKVVIHDDQTPDRIARAAYDILRGWTIAPFKFEGFDESGRAYGTPLSDKETVARAFAMSREYWRLAEEGGHFLAAPLPE